MMVWGSRLFESYPAHNKIKIARNGDFFLYKKYTLDNVSQMGYNM